MSFLARLSAAWRVLRPEQRLAAGCAAALFVTMFLPWYSHSGFAKGRPTSESLRAFEAFSFVEAAVLLVATGVLVLLFNRAEGRRFHLPGGDGTVIAAGGAWAALLTFIRTLDKPDAGPGTIVGVEWGIFLAILAGLALSYAGFRIRAAHLIEPTQAPPGPPATAEHPTRRVRADERPTRVATPARRPGKPEIDGGEQLSFDEQP